MKRFKFFLLVLLVFFLTIWVVVYIFDLGYLFHGIKSTYLRGESSAQIDDYVCFDVDTVSSSRHIEIPRSSSFSNPVLSDSLDSFLRNSETVAFLVIKNDSVVYENYWGGAGVNSYTNSFSMAKSITSLLVACAIKDGYIKSFDEPIVNFLPELKGKADGVLIKHLLEMSSGLNWLENYKRPISVTAKAYYGKRLEDLVLGRSFVEKPGVYYRYNSGNTQLLGVLLKRAVKKPISEYAGKSLWSKIGAKNDALWVVDEPGGIEKTFCCFNSNARDFAKLGLLVLNKGIVGSDTVIGEKELSFLLSSSGLIDGNKKNSVTFGKKQNYYTRSWWKGKVGDIKFIYARGFLGQYIVLIPEINVVFVRLGKHENPKTALKSEYHLTDNLTFITKQIIKEYSY